MIDFFQQNDDFKSILLSVFNDNGFTFNIIPTGWTNLVLDIQHKNNNYIAKFPRNSFWAQQIQKDCDISNFVRENIGINSPEMKIYKDKFGRFFSMHKKINGTTFGEKFNTLSTDDKSKIAKQLVSIFYKLHSFNIDKIDKKYKYDFVEFLNNMIKIANNYDMKYFEELFKDHNNEQLVFAHNDINIGNIIIDENNNIVAIIDYAFAGLSDIYTDLSVISCRTDGVFFNRMIEEYEKLISKTINKEKLQNRIELRQHLEDVYVDYINKNCKEIKI